jgi:hypothetical protein
MSMVSNIHISAELKEFILDNREVQEDIRRFIFEELLISIDKELTNHTMNLTEAKEKLESELKSRRIEDNRTKRGCS